MVTFEINDMTCGHCISSITRALQLVDPEARVKFDLASHRVQVEASRADAAQLAQAIANAGYTPVQTLQASVAPATGVPRTGCCCG